jgi:hypothetical protein
MVDSLPKLANASLSNGPKTDASPQSAILNSQGYKAINFLLFLLKEVAIGRYAAIQIMPPNF